MLLQGQSNAVVFDPTAVILGFNVLESHELQSSGSERSGTHPEHCDEVPADPVPLESAFLVQVQIAGRMHTVAGSSRRALSSGRLLER